MLDNLKEYDIVLASNSPRRKQLLAGLGICFEVKVISGIDESYPAGIPVDGIAQYIAEKKAMAYLDGIKERQLIITADTVVVVGATVLGKPRDNEEAAAMLHRLSGNTHRVITGVCLACAGKPKRSFSVTTDVTFKKLTDEEISYYVDTFHPTDKAGAYGIQEWIGYIGVTEISGSYFNVMGLPVQRLYSELLKL